MGNVNSGTSLCLKKLPMNKTLRQPLVCAFMYATCTRLSRNSFARLTKLFKSSKGRHLTHVVADHAQQ
jgi:hypothetical protein